MTIDDTVTYKMTKLCRVIQSRVRSLHLRNRSSLNYLNVVAFMELMTHAKSKRSNELDRTRGIYLRNDVRYMHMLRPITTAYRIPSRLTGLTSFEAGQKNQHLENEK